MEHINEIILESGRSIALAIDTLCSRKNFSVDERVLTAQVALVEVMAKFEGPEQTIEALRDLADILERQLMAGEIPASH